jgi:hypothetical protein
MPPLSERSTVVATGERVSTVLGGETVILSLGDETYYGLNSIGTRIWQLVQEPRRVSDIRDTILEEYEVSHETCQQDLVRLLEELAGRGLVMVHDETPA